MIGGLARQIADALAILEHGDAIAIEAPDHRTRRAGPERSHRDAGLRLQRRAERGLEVLCNSCPASTEVG